MCRQNDFAYVHVLHDPVVVPLRRSESEKTWFMQAEKHHQTLKTPRSDKNPKSLHRIGALKRRLTSSAIFWAAQGFGHGSWKFIYLVVITVIHPQRVVSWKWAPQPCFWNPSSKTVSGWWLHGFRHMAAYTDLVWNTWSISSHLGKCASATVMVGIFMMVMIVMTKTKINQDIDLKIIKMITMKILNNKTLWKSCLWQPTLPRSFTCKQFKDENAQGPPINCLSKKKSSSNNFHGISNANPVGRSAKKTKFIFLKKPPKVETMRILRKNFISSQKFNDNCVPKHDSTARIFGWRAKLTECDRWRQSCHCCMFKTATDPLLIGGGIRWGVNLCGYLPSKDQSVSCSLYMQHTFV